jgi:hypothetical protein
MALPRTKPRNRPAPRSPGAVLIPKVERDLIRTQIEKVGAVAVFIASGIGRHTLQRVLSGLPVRNGTALLVKNFVSALRAGGVAKNAP